MRPFPSRGRRFFDSAPAAKRVWPLVLLAALFFAARPSPSFSFEYSLRVEKLAEGAYVSLGKKEHFTKENGGDIANVVFFDAGEKVVVVGGGVSKAYGLALKKKIRETLGKEVGLILITNQHPDHYLGINAFDPSIVHASKLTAKNIERVGGVALDMMYVLLGDWMKDTDNVVPGKELKEGALKYGTREFEVIILNGYTPADAVVLEKISGVLVAGGQVFNNRAPTFPNANVNAWIASLGVLSKIKYKVLVPGHGDLDRDGSAIEQTLAYVRWVDGFLKKNAAKGTDANFLFRGYRGTPFENLSVIDEEFPRTVQQLYPDYEREILLPSASAPN